MSGDEFVFDPSITKKKKKKKKEEGGEGLGGGEQSKEMEAKEVKPEGEDKEQVPDEDEGKKKEQSDDLNFFNLKKKKKKAKKAVDHEAEPIKESKTDGEQIEAVEEDHADLPQKVDSEDAHLPAKDDGLEDDELNKDVVLFSSPAEPAWAGSDRDYTYEELLKRAYDMMKAKNQDMVAGEKRKLVLKPPQVVKSGTKKTSFVNFADICKQMHRQPKHVLAFLLAELGTSGSIDGSNQLVIKGRFHQNQIETILRRYIKEYVMCHTCHSPNTILQKDTRLYYLQCEPCTSRCSVASIKTGFQAVTGKRAQLRAKDN